MLEIITKIRSWLCRALRGGFDNLRYVGSYAESYFLLSMIAAAGFFGLVFYIMATQPVGLFPPMEVDVAACTQLKGELPFLSCEPEKIEKVYQLRDKLAHLMRPVKVEWENSWLGFVALFLLLLANISTQLFRQAGFIEAHNKRKLGVLPDPVGQWQKEVYGDLGRFGNAMEGWFEKTQDFFERITKPVLPLELPEPEPERQVVEWVEAEFLAQLDSTMAQNVSNPGFSVHNLADGAGGISKSKLTSILRDLLDCTPSEYITWYRMSRARQLLIKGGPVCEVKKAVGYKNDRSFRELFHTHTKVNPKDYAKRRPVCQKIPKVVRTKKGGNRPNP